MSKYEVISNFRTEFSPLAPSKMRFCVTFLFLNPILPGGGADSCFFFHHPETAQAMKLKLSDFKDTCFKHILQVIPGLLHFEVLPWQQNYK